MYDDDCQESHKFKNSIGGVMVGMLAWSGVDHEIKPWSGQTEDYRIGICFFSAKHAVVSSKSKSLTNFITKCWIKYTLPWAWFELSTLVVIDTDCLGSKFNYYTITTMMAPDNFEEYTLIIEIYSNILVDYVFV